VFLFLLFVAPALAAPVDILTVKYDNDRTAANLRETILNTRNVNEKSFGKLVVFPVDGQIYAQPLVVSGLEIAGKNRNVVFVATMNNSIYAFDADTFDAASALLWHRNVGEPVPSYLYGFRDIQPLIGILSTPVIDRETNTLYLVANLVDEERTLFRLHALDLRTGAEKMQGPVEIKAEVAGSGAGSDKGRLFFEPSWHLQRAGLLLANGVVYFGFGSHGDDGPFHGWLIGYDKLDVRRQIHVLCTSRDGIAASIWQGGYGPAVDAGGQIYLVTGNGDMDGVSNFGQSVVKLNPHRGLAVEDWFSPDAWADLNEDDRDFGSSGAVLVPGTHLLIAGGKDGIIYLLDRNSLGRTYPGNLGAVQKFPAIGFGIFGMALWNRSDTPIMYLQGARGILRAFALSGGHFVTDPVAERRVEPGVPYQGMAVSADGDDLQSGILWVAAADDVLHAYRAADISQELWNSDLNFERDQLGSFSKFASPTVANGRVYVPTFGNQLTVYGLLPAQ